MKKTSEILDQDTIKFIEAWAESLTIKRPFIGDIPNFRSRSLQYNWDTSPQNGEHAGKTIAWLFCASASGRQFIANDKRFLKKLSEANWQVAPINGEYAGTSLGFWLCVDAEGQEIISSNECLQLKLLEVNWDPKRDTGEFSGVDVAWFLCVSRIGRHLLALNERFRDKLLTANWNAAPQVGEQAGRSVAWFLCCGQPLFSYDVHFQKKLLEADWEMTAKNGIDAGISVAWLLCANDIIHQLAMNNKRFYEKLSGINWEVAPQAGELAKKSIAHEIIHYFSAQDILLPPILAVKIVALACQTESSMTPILLQKLDKEAVYKLLMLERYPKFSDFKKNDQLTTYYKDLRATINGVAELYRGYFQGNLFFTPEIIEQIVDQWVKAEHACLQEYNTDVLRRAIMPLIEKRMQTYSRYHARKLALHRFGFFNAPYSNIAKIPKAAQQLAKELIENYDGYQLMTKATQEEISRELQIIQPSHQHHGHHTIETPHNQSNCTLF